MGEISRACLEIHRAWKEGRPIVPLFGAGISVESGIPLTWPMVTYLARLKWYIEEYETPDITEFLLTHGWPEPHDLTSKLIPKLQKDVTHRSLKDIETLIIKKTMLEGQPDIWLQLLGRITDGRQDLKDLFFDRLEVGRGPSTCHQFIAFLTVLMNWRLILTTNFDPFIEQAIRNISVEPRLYELPDRGPIPDPELVKAHLSVLKVHGGSFARLMSEDLSHSLLKHERDQLLNYLPDHNKCLMLIVGYGGGDRRVMSFLRDFVRSKASDLVTPRLIWVDRNDRPEFAHTISSHLGLDIKNREASKRVIIVQGADGARFLQELHCRLTTTHRATPTSYDVFPHLPLTTLSGTIASESQSNSTAPAATPLKLEPHPRVVVFHSEVEGAGTSTKLSQFVKRQQDHTIIWCDLGLGIFASVEALLSFLEREFRKYDPAIPLFSIFPPAHSASEADPRISYVVEALERGHYLIAVDSLGEFRTAHITDDADCRPYLDGEKHIVVGELKRLYFLLEQLAKQLVDSSHCESMLCVAHTPLHVGEQKDLTATRGMAVDFLQAMAKSGASLIPCASARRPPEMRAKSAWNDSDSDAINRLTLCVCAVFRRPRSIVILRRLLAHFIQMDVQNGLSLDAVATFGTSQVLANGDTLRDEVDSRLDNLMTDGLLVHEDGGFFWMHRVVRDTLYKEMRHVHKEKVADLHDMVASYYYHDVYLPSKDTEALFEYVYHRLASMRFYGDCTEVEQRRRETDRNIRARELIVVIQRERDQLLTHRRPGLLIPWIRYVRDTELKAMLATVTQGSGASNGFQIIYNESRSVLCELEAECLRQSGAYAECIVLRSKQINDRLCELELGDKHIGRSGVALVRAAEHLLTNDDVVVVRALADAMHAAIEEARTASLQKEGRQSTFLRLIDHAIEVSACLIGLYAPDGLVQGILQWASKEIGTESQYSSATQAIREQAKDLSIRCSHRQMELELAPLSIWTVGALKPQLESAAALFGEGNRQLRDYTGHRDRNFFRYTCVLNTLRARCAYLERQFEEAYRWLEAASAAIRRPVRGSEFSTSAICLMHHAECLIYHAEVRLDPKTTGPLSDAAWSRAKAKLERARIDLERAQDLLTQGRPQLWAWTRLFMLWAQLNHDLLLLSLDKEPAASETSDDEEANRLNMDRSRYVLSALRSIRAALDSGSRDKIRTREAKILWHQLYVCQAFRESLTGEYQAFEATPAETSDSGLNSRWHGVIKLVDSYLSGKKAKSKDGDDKWKGFNQLARLDRQCETWVRASSDALADITAQTLIRHGNLTTVREVVLCIQQDFVHKFFKIGAAPAHERSKTQKGTGLTVGARKTGKAKSRQSNPR